MTHLSVWSLISLAGCLFLTCDERLATWVTSAQEMPREGWVTETSITSYPGSGKRRETTRKAVLEGADYLFVQDVVDGASPGQAEYTRIYISNPDYVAQLRRISDRPWVLEKLSLSSDPDFAESREAWFRLDPMEKLADYAGILDVVSRGQYSITNHSTEGTRERFDIQVTTALGDTTKSRWSEIEYFSAVFEEGIPIPVEISGKHKGRNRHFSRALLNWQEIDGQKVPTSQVLKTDDKDQPAVAVVERTLDLSQFDQPVDSAIFYLAHYGLPEPNIEIGTSTYLLYGCILLAIVLVGWIVRARLKLRS